MKVCLTTDFLCTHTIHISKLDGACDMYREEKKEQKVSVRNPVRKTPLRRHKHTWENNNTMDIQEYDGRV
jgi:hypothetical protein